MICRPDSNRWHMRESTSSMGNAPQVAFIVGMARAGTTWMMNSLNMHPEIVSFGETAYFGANWHEPDHNGEYGAEQLRKIKAYLKQVNMHTCYEWEDGGIVGLTPDTQARIVEKVFDELLPGVQPGQVFLRFSSAIQSISGKAFVVEKTPHHINWTDRILTSFPEAKFICMLRDPYEFMLSYKHQPGTSEESRRYFERIYHPFGAALVARGYYKAARKLDKLPNQQRMFVRMEDIKEAPEVVMHRAIKFLGYSVPDSYTPAGQRLSSFRQWSGKPDSHSHRLDAEDIYWLNLIAGSEIRAAGYNLRHQDTNPLQIVTSYAQLPMWGVRTMQRFRRRIGRSWIKYLLRWV